jgi:uncharacterized membrane protein YcaP (DUF421 family)
MASILIRTVIVYVFLSVVLKVLGKRQVGELEISELITTLLVSEMAVIPMENHDIPIMYAVVPIITISCFEIISSWLLANFEPMKNIFSSRPNTLIGKGKINQQELKDLRISIDELISELRLQGFSDLQDVEYAILEHNGRLSVIPKAKSKPIAVGDLDLKIAESGITHILVSEGKINKHTLNMLNQTPEWVLKQVESLGSTLEKVYIMTIDDAKKINLIEKDLPQ